VLFELRDVGLTRAGRAVLDGVSAGIPASATAIVGPSGSGKSTLLRLLNRLADTDQGEISYRGEPLAGYDPLALRRQVALVPQLPALLEGTVESNLAYAAGLAGKELDTGRCLRLAGLDRDVAKLSVGEQQRAMLGRALAQGPRVLLLDEPTSALDHAARDAIEAALTELRRELEIAVVLVTHDPEQARRLSDWVVRLEAGRVAGCGALEEVLA
jgi:putative ABC transport system ATP-binding protein